jgi:phage terminase Nu1 subunit (DNA packaging protein)
MADRPCVNREENSEIEEVRKVREFLPKDLSNVEDALLAQAQRVQQALKQNEGAKNVSQKALEFEVSL